MFFEKGPDEGAAEVVEALDVGAGGVADGPEVEDTFEEELEGGVMEERDGGSCAGEVDEDLTEENCASEASARAVLERWDDVVGRD